MRLLDTNVRFFDQDVTKAQLDNEWGKLVVLLDEVLVNGTDPSPMTVTKVTEETDYWLATITTSKPHGYKALLSVVELSGPITGLHRVQEIIDKNNFIIALPKANKPTTGDGTHKLPPLGYEITNQSGGKRIYASKRPNKNYLRVDDTPPIPTATNWVKQARVSIYSDIKSVDDIVVSPGRLKAPYEPGNDYGEVVRGAGNGMVMGWCRWVYKGNSRMSYDTDNSVPDSPLKDFYILGDDRTFYMGIQTQIYDNYSGNFTIYSLNAFGEYTDNVTPDNTHNCMLLAYDKRSTVDYSTNTSNENPPNIEVGRIYTRNYHKEYRDILTGCHMLNPDGLSNVDIPSSRFNLVGPIKNISGTDTGASFDFYNTFIPLVKPHIVQQGFNYSVFRGTLRGYHWIAADVGRYPLRAPKIFDIIKNPLKADKKYVVVNVLQYKERLQSHANVAFELNNWE